MILLYDTFIFLLQGVIRLAAFFNHPKAQLWIEGRKNVFQFLSNHIAAHDNVIWIHAASLGEFEQGRPLIEKIKAEAPDKKIVLTFYSPSGYEIRKNYTFADVICYLPIDSVKNAQRFLNLTHPSCIIFIKYEFWFHYLNEATKRKIPTIYIAALFWDSMSYFRWYLQFFIPIFQNITHFYVQNEASKTALLKYVFKNNHAPITIAGDPRIDRVLQIAKEAKSFPLIEQFCNKRPTLIAGSTWEKDELLLKPLLHSQKQWCFIIAPHDIEEKRLQFIENQYNEKIVVRYSALLINPGLSGDILLIDNIGMLSSIYRYAKVVYIGGGFGQGIHNTLEPMAFGLPVIFGKKYQKFEEAKYMIAQNAAFSVLDSSQLTRIFKQLEKKDFYDQVQQKVIQYMQQNKGATDKINLNA
jgi:3-deoxy-D-manno-octulosonic-acid transferase